MTSIVQRQAETGDVDARDREAGPHLAMRKPAWRLNAMSVDVEDYFQVSAMEHQVSRESWGRFDCRVEANVDRLLAMFDACGVTATFFTLAWVARRYPGMTRRIVEAGHEIASHGSDHVRVSDQTPTAFRADIRAAKRVIEDIAGEAVTGYRAASFSLTARTDWAHAILAEEGHRYSSSVYPIRHDHYGLPDAPRTPYSPVPGDPFLEVPIATVQVGRRRLPGGGGGYFRLLPYAYSAWALKRLNGADGAAGVFYFHPWEIDPGQPRIPGLSLKTRLRHYTNLSRMAGKLERLLAEFSWGRMDAVFLDGPAAARTRTGEV